MVKLKSVGEGVISPAARQKIIVLTCQKAAVSFIAPQTLKQIQSYVFLYFL